MTTTNLTDLNEAERALWGRALGPDETLLWAGRPDTSLRLRRSDWPPVLIAVGLMAVSILAMIASVNGDAPIWFVILFALLGLFGFAMIPMRLVQYQKLRRRTLYALTDQRALIVEGQKVPMLRAYPLAQTNRLDIAKQGGPWAILWFKDEYAIVGGQPVLDRHPYEIGFEFIRDADLVCQMMTDNGAGQSDEKTGLTEATPLP